MTASKLLCIAAALSTLALFASGTAPAAGSIAVSDYRLGSMGMDVSPREVSKTLGTGNFASPVGIPGIISTNPRVYPVAKKTWFVTNDNDASSAWGWGVGRRTKDGGQTWDTPADPGVGGGGVIHYALDAGGRLWALWHDSSDAYTRTRLSYSDDGGDSWSTPVFSMGSGTWPQQVRGWKVLTHPNNPNTIAIIGFADSYFGGLNNRNGWIAYSLDRGTTWTITGTPTIREGQPLLRWAYDAVMLPSNRIVFQGPLESGSPVRWRTRFTDDFGQTVTTSWSMNNSQARINGLFWKDNRVAFFHTININSNPIQHRLVLSTDGGSTFTQVSLGQELEAWTGVNFQLTRFAALPEVDAIYLGTYDGDEIYPPVSTKRVVRLSPVSTSGTWTDLTANHPHNTFGNDNLGVVPQLILDARNTFGGAGALGCKNCPHNGDPVNLATGNFNHRHIDVYIPGRGYALEFVRSYNSLDGTVGRLGYGWQDNLNIRLAFNDSDHAAADVTVISEFGRQDDYLRQADGTYLPPPGVFDTLTRNPTDGTFELRRVDQAVWRFDANGSLLSIRDRNSNTTTFTYTAGKLTSITESPGGRSLTFNYDNPTYPDRITKVTDPIGRTIEFTYDAAGDLTQVKDVKGGFTAYGYINHRMTSLTDANSHLALQNWYDSAGRVAEQQDGVAGKTCIYFGTLPSYTSAACTGLTPAPSSSETALVDPRGNKTTYVYNSALRTTDVKDAATPAGVIHYDYDTNYSRVCITDQRGYKTAYAYDAKGNVTQIIDALNTDANCQLKAGGVKWTFTYTANNDIASETDPLDRLTEYVYDAAGNLTRVVRKDSQVNGRAVGALTCFERDPLTGQMTASVESTDLVVPPGPTDPCTGNRTLYGYDTYGNQTCVVNARFSSTTQCSQSPAKKTTFQYDLGGRLLFVTNELTNGVRPPVGAPETGAAQCGTSGNGNGADNDGDAVADDGCPSTAYTYDPQNNVLTVVDGLGNTTTNTYEAKGNLKTILDANGKLTTYNYDNGDRLAAVIDALGQTTSYGYDANGNRTSVTNPKRQPVGAAESGAQCDLSGQSNGTGNDVDEDGDGTKDDGCPSTISAYDALNRLQSVTDALGRVTSYQYDPASNLSQRTDGRGLVTKYFPDALNRLDLIEHWNGATLVDSVDYSYDALGNRTQMVDSTGTTTYTPDALNRISSVTFPGPKTLSYTYDDLPGGLAADYPGQRTRIAYPDSKTATYTYLADGSMSTVTDWLSKVTTYTYDDAGRLSKTQYPNTVWTDFTYDAADRLTGVVNQKPGPITISSFTYTLDSVGNRKQMVAPDGSHTYQYDPVYRLTQVTYPGPTTDAYGYDAAGNRLTKNATSYTYDAADQMTLAGGVSYGYDANGNQTSRGGDAFSYDHENRLTEVRIGGGAPNPCYDFNGDGVVDGTDVSQISNYFGGQEPFYDLNGDGFVDGTDITAVGGQFGQFCTSRFSYNGDGLRTARAGSHLNWKYVWDVAVGLPVILKETDSHNELDGHGTNNTYVYGLDPISVTDRTGAQSYYLYDGLGSVTGVTDASGNLVSSFTYDVFGEIRSASSGGNESEFRFTGEQRDPQLQRNFYYLRARYYDPTIGRLLSQDPLPGGNPYAYVGNNPVNLVDPSGLTGIAVINKPLGACTNFTFNPFCQGGGGGGGSGIIVIGGGVIVIGAAAGVAVAAGEEIAEVPGEAWGGLTSLFSKKGGKSDDRRIDSITSYSEAIHYDVCRLPGLRDKSSVQSDIQKRIKNMQTEYRHLGPVAKREAVRIFKDKVWNNPCDPQPSTVFPPIIGDGRTGGGKE